MQNVMDMLNDIIWSYFVIYGLLGLGLYFTYKTGFIQFRYLKEMVRVIFEKSPEAKKGEKSISSFKSFCIGSATRIGTGNLAGVAVAVTLGGPGAVFWMWVVGLLGGATSFIESTLAQVYKVKDKDTPGTFRGGPAYYITKGLNKKWLGVIFAVLIAFTFGLIFNSVQSNTISAAFEGAFGFNTTATGIVLVILSGIVIFGGVHRIANVTSVVVPIMAVLYIAVALFVLVTNISQLPAVLSLIVNSAFGLEQAVGGGIGAAIMHGVRRGLFSNEAGMGSAPNAAATAHVSHPAKQGFIQTLGVYIDTLVVCTATAFIILISTDLSQAGNEEGINLLQTSLSTQIGGWASIFIAVAVFLFAFSSIIGSYYYGETNIQFIKDNKTVLNLYRFATMGFVMIGAVASLGFVWELADIFMGLMAIINLAAIALLSGIAVKTLKDYQAQRKQGLNPTFNASRLGIKNTECWEEKEEKKERIVS
ncbi:alanine/glycine:cation symporter family protein [Alteribacter keqinensis]|uniref:Alanine:cation symporter family protein n=1 Tax=Alteribacter keqinensis TaxID=2483800 RepID=A0A3M7TRY6_9BACI|nr:alanine/glycine:cation symporter family protein [Alteribacter keqinensis]RNA67979.1 alanine:cation symporter family protein [Alteribacter keqinensis]